MRVTAVPLLPFFLGVLAPFASAQEDRFTPELVAGLRSVTAAVLAPDGARCAYLLSVPRKAGVDEDGPAWAELWVEDVAGLARPFVAGKVNASAPAWTRPEEHTPELQSQS